MLWEDYYEPKNKRFFKVKGSKPLLKTVRIAVLDTPIQAEAQIVFPLGAKGNECL